ncbi:hypothetical protein HTV45_17575 [Streptomyces sp. CHD11]|uniref:SCO2400 family protein n=1 Tax=Streptomyces sp. CHD11 TaxID=2741325 RepID=UPI001BFC6F9A|nr:hypothetical protein [Streptomyces sp. CHD11]MBT3152662.1 hypothetical protein [Streptomyces sp. CHD11]
MDYCSTCRRHLNGALVCPGCGAYAPDIAPGVIGGRTVPGTATTEVGPAAVTAPGSPAAPGPVRGRPGGVPADAPLEAPGSSGTGRAARRRQLARWKKTQRRALVATAVALVGGGLALTSMNTGTGDRTQATTAPDLKGLGGATGPADGSAAPASPTASPDRAPRSAAADDIRRTADTPAPASTAPPRAPAGTRTDAAPPPRTAAPDAVSRSGARPGTGRDGNADTGQAHGSASGAAPGHGSGSGSGAATRPTPSTPPPAADDSSGTGTGTGGTDQGESSRPAPATPPAAAPDSSRLCLLVICLG